jgi:hypothetical protein
MTDHSRDDGSFVLLPLILFYLERMKSRIVITSLLAFTIVSLLITTAATAQYSSSWWGIRAGASMGSETTTLPEEASGSFKFGPMGGLTFDHWFGEYFGFGASLLYNAKGVSQNYGASVNRHDTLGHYFSGDDNFSYSYLEIPLVFKASFGYGDIKPYVFAGPSVGLLLGASEAVTENIPQVKDLKSHLAPIEVSAYFGAGIIDRIYNGPMLSLDLGYAAGLTKVYKDTPSDRAATQTMPFSNPIDPTDAKSSDIRITVAVMWKL